MTETLYVIRLESGGGSLNGEVLGTADTLKDAREGAVSFRENVLPDAELTVWRMERVGDDDDE